MTLEQAKNMNRNPSGKGGLGEHPENINFGGRPKNQQSFAYWMNYFKNLSVKDFKEYTKTHPKDKRFVAEDISFYRVLKSRKDLSEFKEVANRTEGMPKQTTDLTTNGEKIEIILKGDNGQGDNPPSSD